MKEFFVSLFIIAIILPQYVTAESVCSANLLLDAQSGDIIEANNETTPLPPASTIKILVAYVVYEKVKSGEVSLDDVITVSAAASKIGGSQVYLKHGETFTLRELVGAVLVQSANDASYAIAEHLGGSVEGFLELLNSTAKELGMKDTVVYSVHGLPPERDQKPDMASASDFGVLARAAINNHPEILEFTKISEMGFRNDTFNMRNHNPLVRTYPGCDGLKTGYYSKAGFSVVTTAKRKGTRLIAVVLGCKDRKKRNADAARLLTKGFAEYKQLEIAKANTPVDTTITVENGERDFVKPIISENLTLSVRKSIAEEIVTKVEPCSSLIAPYSAPIKCGEVSYYHGEQKLGSVPLVVTEAMAEKTGFAKVVDYIRNF